MSGGVDSAVSAALLVEAGYDVVGVTMRLGYHDSVEPDADRPSCCGADGILDARRVASQLGIPFYPVNYENAFAESVVGYFTDEYLKGRTPNPCMLCNQELKFGRLLALADELDAEYVATGHYARVIEQNGRFTLLRGRDVRKDQSYVLFSTTQTQLARTLFPIGEMTKTDVREYARRHALANADKAESQEICFIADDNYRRFLKERLGDAIEPGPIVARDGTVLGHHDGTPFYTVGQRKGLRIASPHPLYVTEIHARDKTIVVGADDELFGSTLRADNVNWVSIEPPGAAIRATVKIRYRDAGALATVTPLGADRAEVVFDVPRRAITPGQAAVFYDGESVLGGGWIA
jgi:tRNA-specific 2-thiouridylase